MVLSFLTLNMVFLYKSLGIATLTTLLRSRHPRWLGHVMHSKEWVNHCFNLDVVWKCGKDQP